MSDIYSQSLELLNDKKYSEARMSFLSGLEQEPDNIQLLTGLANAEYKLGAGFRSEILLHAALTLEPDNKKIQDFLHQVRSNPSSSKKGTIGISMIVKNEEQNLPAALESIKEIADELVVVDTGSTDNTVKIAEEFGAKIFRYEWNDDFASARNFGLQKNEAEWVLYIDADERLEKSSIPELKKLAADPDPSVGAYICKIISVHRTTGKRDEYHGRYPRFFRNYGFPFIYFFGKIHEQISPLILDLGKKVKYADIEILHEGYDVSQEEMNRKVKRNLGVLINHTKTEPTNAFAWYQLGMTLAQMNMDEQAEKVLLQAVSFNSLAGYMQSNTFLTLAGIYFRKEDFPNAVKYAHDSLNDSANPIPATNILAHSILRLNKPDEAITIFEQMKKYKSEDDYLLEIDIPDEFIEKGIELALKAKGSPE